MLSCHPNIFFFNEVELCELQIASGSWKCQLLVRIAEASCGSLLSHVRVFLYCFGDYKFGWQLLLIIIVLSIICSDFMLMHLIKYLVWQTTIADSNLVYFNSIEITFLVIQHFFVSISTRLKFLMPS